MALEGVEGEFTNLLKPGINQQVIAALDERFKEKPLDEWLKILHDAGAPRGPVGTATEVASSLFGWQQLRFEITEDQTSATAGGRWMHTPVLGIFHMQTDVVGNGVLSEDAVRAAIAAATGRLDFATVRLSDV